MLSLTLVPAITIAFAALAARAQTYSATYLPSNAPAQSEQGQTGTNQCSSGSNQTSNCQNVFCKRPVPFRATPDEDGSQ
jgi:hypothetical protein